MIKPFDIFGKDDIKQQYELYKLQVIQTIYIDGTKLDDPNKIEKLVKLRMISWRYSHIKTHETS